MDLVIRPAPRASGVRAVTVALATDVVLVVVFAAVGRASHDETLTVAGVLQTSWPFLVGLVAGWLVTLGRRRPFAPLRTGVGVWAVTVAGGMLLRMVSGEGTAVAFVIVAAVTLLVFLVGWRLIVAAVRGRQKGASSGSGTNPMVTGGGVSV
ncbi:DUF3054 domain-containing protein [Microbacterium sp. HA-8]|uniref:DUF3054 domain-containing protein n=1 Tax=Microbacterium sp. HA-8 TaxID=3234200 RepID=UPI0038F762E1